MPPVKQKSIEPEAKLDLFKDIIPAISRRDTMYYQNATEEGRKTIRNSFWMLQRFLSNPNQKNIRQFGIQMVSNVTNPDWSEITHHPNLRWKLLCMCGIQPGTRYAHPGVPLASRKMTKIGAIINEIIPGVKDTEIEMILRHMDVDALRSWFEDMGYSDDVIADALPQEKKKSKKAAKK